MLNQATARTRCTRVALGAWRCGAYSHERMRNLSQRKIRKRPSGDTEGGRWKNVLHTLRQCFRLIIPFLRQSNIVNRKESPSFVATSIRFVEWRGGIHAEGLLLQDLQDYQDYHTQRQESPYLTFYLVTIPHTENHVNPVNPVKNMPPPLSETPLFSDKVL